MRRFSSYGPPNPNVHYYAPRKELIEKAYTHLMGENPTEGGHYITVWAPRQTGKSWTMREILFQLRKNTQFDILAIPLEYLKDKKNVGEIIAALSKKIGEGLGKKFSGIKNQDKFQDIFKKGALDKPLILILDEFDALCEEAINALVSVFRNIYGIRRIEIDKPTEEKTYLLHGIALIGVRSVLGIEQEKGSPFNVQRSLHIPNLTYDEVHTMFKWYEKENGQAVEKSVIDALYREIQGQPGLTCWFGELLTEGFEERTVDKSRPITLRDFEIAYAAATYVLPNNNILNIISKANKEPHKEFVLQMFQTDEKITFRFDNKSINALYMNGVVDKEVVDDTNYYVKFSSPFVQKRLFNFFADELFSYMGRLTDPFVNLDNVITDTDLNIRGIMGLYRDYLKNNKEWLFKSAPRRTDMRIFEAVFHFNLYSYLSEFLKTPGGNVFPEFPTGNGKIDLVVKYGDLTYGIELKSYTNERNYKEALEQTAKYGKQLGLPEIFLVFFIEYIDDENREKVEQEYRSKETGVTVKPIIIETGT